MLAWVYHSDILVKLKFQDSHIFPQSRFSYLSSLHVCNWLQNKIIDFGIAITVINHPSAPGMLHQEGRDGPWEKSTIPTCFIVERHLLSAKSSCFHCGKSQQIPHACFTVERYLLSAPNSSFHPFLTFDICPSYFICAIKWQFWSTKLALKIPMKHWNIKYTCCK